MVNAQFWHHNTAPEAIYDDVAASNVEKQITPDNFFDIIDIGSPTAAESGTNWSHVVEILKPSDCSEL